MPCGSETVPRIIWSALRGSTPSRNATSTVSSNLACGQLLEELERLAGHVLLVAVDAWRRLAVALAVSRSCPTSTPMLRAVPSMIRIAPSTSLAFRSTIFRSAISRTWSWVDPGDLVAVGLARSLLDAGRLLDQLGRRRLLGDEREDAVLVDRELDGDDLAANCWVASLYCRQKSMMFTPCWPSAVPTGRRGRGLAGLDLQLDDGARPSCVVAASGASPPPAVPAAGSRPPAWSGRLPRCVEAC